MLVHKVLLALIVAAMAAKAGALDVIADTGKTIPVPDNLYLIDHKKAAAMARQIRVQDQRIVADYAQLFPLTTPELTLGHLIARKHDKKLPMVLRPLFLVGCDRTSAQWLNTRKDWLMKHRATGMVVECPSLSLYRHMAASFQGLTLMPASGSSLASVYQLKHYPAIITTEGVLQ